MYKPLKQKNGLLTMTMSISYRFHLKCISFSDMLALMSFHESLLKESGAVFRISGSFLSRSTHIERSPRSRVLIGFGVRLRPGTHMIKLSKKRGRGNAYSGIWKNINALGFASLLVSGVICSSYLSFQAWSRSLLLSGVNGLSIWLIEAVYG